MVTINLFSVSVSLFLKLEKKLSYVSHMATTDGLYYLHPHPNLQMGKLSQLAVDSEFKPRHF